MNRLEFAPVATALVVLYAVVGGALVLLSALDAGVDPDLRLNFKTYLEQMAVAVAGLAVGRGLAARGR